MLKLKFTCKTDGSGFWSKTKKEVRCTGLLLVSVSEDLCFGELLVVFNTKDWDTLKESVIYTDNGFTKDLKKNLISLGFSKQAVGEIEYSEYGMQGAKFVSFDIGPDMIAELLFNGVASQDINA